MEHKLASIGTRVVALIIDTACVLVWILTCIFLMNLISKTLSKDAGEVIQGIVGLVIMISPFLYFSLFEGTLSQTPGKMVMRIKVNKMDETKVTMGDALIRNALRYLNAFFFIDYLSALGTTRQRLGDRAAKTIVIVK